MSRRAFWLIAVAYACLAIGAAGGFYLNQRQQDDIEQLSHRLVGAAVAYCEAGIAPDAQEKHVIDQLSRSEFNPGMLDPICERIGRRLNPEP